MIPNDHGRGGMGVAGLQRPGSATPSDLGVGAHEQMANASSHAMQQFRGAKMNPLQQGMIPTNMPGHHGQGEGLSLHRLSSSGDASSINLKFQAKKLFSPVMQCLCLHPFCFALSFFTECCRNLWHIMYTHNPCAQIRLSLAGLLHYRLKKYILND